MGSQRRSRQGEGDVANLQRGRFARPASAGSASGSSGLDRITILQRTVGNRAVTSMLRDDPAELAASVPTAGGSPLAPAVMRSFERAFDTDLSTVRVHADDAAEQSAAAWSAVAYTAGEHLVFGKGSYAPGTAQGDHLLAHELAHVVQQRDGAVKGQPVPGTNIQVSEPGDASERAAEEAARRVTARRSDSSRG